MIRKIPAVRRYHQPVPGFSSCEHRTVAKDGRIVCAKIVEGDNAVSPDVCGACPFKNVNCSHLRFALQQTSPSPLIVRFNGRTEIWDDDPPQVLFQRAACSAKVMPIENASACDGCTLRQAIETQGERPIPERARRVVAGGKVVPFPAREPVAATG